MTSTYGAPDRIDGTTTQDGYSKHGGYSKHIVVREEFVLQIPDGMDMVKAAHNFVCRYCHLFAALHLER